jgi:hypothetical protein
MSDLLEPDTDEVLLALQEKPRNSGTARRLTCRR